MSDFTKCYKFGIQIILLLADCIYIKYTTPPKNDFDRGNTLQAVQSAICKRRNLHAYLFMD